MYWAVVGGPLHIRTLLLKKRIKCHLHYTPLKLQCFSFFFFNTAVFGPEDHCGRSTGCCKSRHLSSVTHYCGKYIYEDIITIFFAYKSIYIRVLYGIATIYSIDTSYVKVCFIHVSSDIAGSSMYKKQGPRDVAPPTNDECLTWDLETMVTKWWERRVFSVFLLITLLGLQPAAAVCLLVLNP